MVESSNSMTDKFHHLKLQESRALSWPLETASRSNGMGNSDFYLLPPSSPSVCLINDSATKSLQIQCKEKWGFCGRLSSLKSPIWTFLAYQTGSRNPLNGGGVGSQGHSLSSRRAICSPTPHSSHAEWVPHSLSWVRDCVNSWQQASLCRRVPGILLTHLDTAKVPNDKPHIWEALQNFPS